MSDLIDRQAAIDAVSKIPIYVTLDFGKECGKISVVSPEAILYAIQNLPSAQQTGRWIWIDGVRCSRCNHKFQTTGLPSYCPNCGAKMEVEHEL